MTKRAKSRSDDRREPADLRNRLRRLLPESPVADLMEFLDHFAEIREILEADQRRGSRGGRNGQSQAIRKLALRHLRSALEDIQQALKQIDDPSAGGLAGEVEWDFDGSFGPSPRKHHFRVFRAYVDHLIPVVTRLHAGKRGRPPEKARDTLDREVVRAVYDADLLGRSGRGQRSVLHAVLEIVYEFCGYPPPDEKSPGVRKALQQFRVLKELETTGRVRDIRESAPLRPDRYREK